MTRFYLGGGRATNFKKNYSSSGFTTFSNPAINPFYGYVTEDGNNYYVNENNSSNYVPES